MKLLVLPPHRDVTLVSEAPEGWHVLDVARDFCRRVVSAPAMTVASDARVAAPASPQSMRELLLLRSAQVLLERDGHTRLRALGAVLTAISGPPSGVRLRLDDLELEEGTTERSADVLRAVGQPAPYTEDLARAADDFTKAERVRLWLERDQQLPAAAWLARACPAHVPLELAGPFALAHRDALARMPVFQRAELIDTAAPLRWRVAPLSGEPDSDALLWIPEALDVCTPEELRAFTGGASWGGHVALDSLVHAKALVESGCRVAVVGFCAVRDGFVVDPFGRQHRTEDLARGARHLKDAGVRVVAEWWIGAPGVDLPALESTLAALDAEPVFHHIAGARPFHWTLHRRDADRRFQWSPVQLRDPAEDRDLARSRPFDAPATLSGSQLQEVLTSLATRLMQRASLNPGRVAAAYLLKPADKSPRVDTEGAPIRLDDDCALVQLPASLDGTPKPTWYAANLRTGTVLAMDARLAPKLSTLNHATPMAEALAAVPEAQRRKLVDTLVAKTVLTKVHG